MARAGIKHCRQWKPVFDQLRAADTVNRGWPAITRVMSGEEGRALNECLIILLEIDLRQIDANDYDLGK